MSVRTAVVGGGPGGLFAAALIGRGLPGAEVIVYERNERTDAFGFGVVFSDATLRAIDAADPVLRKGLEEFGTHWNSIGVWNRDERHHFTGNGMAAIHRRKLLELLQANAEQAGATLRFGEEAPGVDRLAEDFDLVIGADGTNSTVRRHLGDEALGHSTETAVAKFIWFGTTYLFDGLTFVHRESEHGAFAVHGYPISDELSTFIVETDEATWRRAGLDSFDVTQPPGTSDTQSQQYLEKLFADDIEGAELVTNNSRWGNFVTRRTSTWHEGNVALLGDAVHTAHFSVGSGTKMAMEDAVVLAEEIVRTPDELPRALEAYEATRQASVAKIQSSARPSLSWWERFGQYRAQLDPTTFAFHFFSRTIDIERIARRDPDLVESVRTHWRDQHGSEVLETPLALPGLPRSASGRVLRWTAEGDEVTLHDDEGEVLRASGSSTGPALVVQAPQREDDVDGGLRDVPDTAEVVVVRGGADLPRTLLCEELRLSRSRVVILADEVDDAVAETLVVSGRVDAVARSAQAEDSA
ncbi:FAD-dependent monooxygenase [Aeromicrobium sp. CF4.19]|uniref:FAD-dependent monooxygenase n=1 Tax=Aeromicrobium sp. CF4.19 TaxID=3373082 RepID=UPI003EE4CEB5